MPGVAKPKATCTDCDTVPTMTPQCTDQCIIVACNDADHIPTCDMPCPGDHCHLGCEDAANCRDCSKFDKFLECCTDFHSYYEEPRNHLETTWSWDPSLRTFVCNCGGGSTADSIPCGPGDSQLRAAIFDNDFVTDSASTPSPRPAPVPPISTPFALACMWGDCGVSFSSLSDLAEHVNTMHLCHPPSLSSLPSSDVRDLFSMSCQWKDCNIYPTPDSVPGPSSGDIEAILGVLSSHLLHDHLGLNGPPNHFHASAQSPQVLPHDSPHIASNLVQEPAVPSPPSAEDESQAGHVCRWVSCGQSFSSLDDLTLHLTNVHVGTGKQSYDCHWQDCPRHGESGFASKQKLCRHLQSHTGHRPFQCKICLQNFSEAATLQQHMRRHTQEKPYVCDYPGCGKSFAITGALTIHKRTHNGHRPFKCPHCEKAFSESSNLSKHLRTHTGVKPYSCSEADCNKSFARADQLTRHARVHNKQVSNRC
ncbi:hypothetical protein B0H17DRAFT_445851 [Mycena rosella]|uniref:C2H2-type domain-containing protein n=1 Tax=Mycena rosella TaxID=1033263 RepID=A0AAD7DPM0_MYCRO|nr:hypothetical protein B0H17DRAFT_445851 [Mycena rosella]